MIVHGAGEVLVPAHLNFGKFILDRLRKADPDSMSLQNCKTGEVLTYRQYIQHAIRLSAALTQRGLKKGDTVMVGGDPCITFMPTGLAVVLAGAAYTPIELECGRAVLTHKLNLTRPKYVIFTRLFWEAYSDVLKTLDFIETFICFDPIDDIQLSVATLVSNDVDVDSFEATVVKADDVALVAYSSGTTGMSKGVVLTHLNCIARCDTQGYYDFESLETVFFRGELCSTYVTFVMYSFLCAGRRVLYSENKIDKKTLRKYQINTMPTISTIVEELLSDEDDDFGCLKVVYSGSGPLLPGVKKAYKQRYPHLNVLDLYGMTEVGLITTQGPTDEDTATVGVAAPGVTIKVVDVETRLNLGPNERGEVCVWTPCLMKGYLGATAPYLDEQGFYLTGDLGYYDDQKRFYLVDRIKDIISFRAKKVCPAEVEAVLLRHPAVREVAVVGKPMDPEGELPTAFVVLRPGASATEDELVGYVAQEVTWYMRLAGGVRFLSELPRNLNRKVLRRQLRDILVAERNGH